MVFQLEKLMKEHKDKISDTDRGPLEAAMKKVRDVAQSEDADKIKSALDELEQASHAFSKTLYEAGSRGAGPTPGSGPGAAPGGDGAHKPGDEEAIDAEFEVKE
jgi:molecular chaperone DnaK